jgi:opacity protein-like surface antigen
LALGGFPNSRTKLWHLASVCLIASASPASADSVWPTLQADFSIEIEDDYIFRSSDPELELNEAYATVDGELSLAFASGTGLYATATFEPVIDPEDDRIFEDYGLYLEELYLAYRIGAGVFRIGKFDPEFGIADDAAPGIYGDDLSGDYELTERIGASVDISLQALGGEHIVSAAAFMADRTPLSDSLFTSRGRLTRKDGGASNTAYPESFALSAVGEIEGTGYTLGLRYQGAGTGDEADEYGGVVGLIRTFDLAAMETSLFGELAYFPHFDGGRESASFLTLGAEAAFGNFSISAVYGLLKIEDLSPDRLATISLEYDLSDQLSIGAGYRFLRVERETIHTVGALLTYEFGLY